MCNSDNCTLPQLVSYESLDDFILRSNKKIQRARSQTENFKGQVSGWVRDACGNAEDAKEATIAIRRETETKSIEANMGLRFKEVDVRLYTYTEGNFCMYTM